MKAVYRGFATRIRPAVKIPNESFIKDKKVTFGRNFPIQKRTKAWEKDGMDKDEWFKKKYSHVHAKQKSERALNGDVDPFGKRQKFYDNLKQQEVSKREQYRKHKNGYAKTHPLQGLRPNPLVDYIYGTNSVISALRAKKREYFIKLYHYGALNTEINSLCSKSDIRIEEVDKHRLNLLSDYGIHNNVILECKPLHTPELMNLGSINPEAGTFDMKEIDYDQPATIRNKYLTNEYKKYPLGIYLDEVVDPHNVGAIMRSAYFLGADFLILSHRNCAPLSPVVSKVSSGTMELLPIYKCDKPLQFFEKSKEEGGWTFVTSHVQNSPKENHLELNDLSGMVKELPVILVVGNEGNGARTNILNRSDFTVEIPFGRAESKVHSTIDSLNVSVAAALLINKILN